MGTDPAPNARSPKVFISYSHDSAAHVDLVRDLSDRLRADGVDCNIDQYETSPARGWARWMSSQIEEADFVLVVCTAEYRRRFDAATQKDTGTGAKWEGGIITLTLYLDEGDNEKFVPVLFSRGDVANIPKSLRGATYYAVCDGGRIDEEGYESLYRRLTNQPSVLKPALGKLRPVEPRGRQQSFSAADAADGGGDSGGRPDAGLELHLAAQRRIVEEHTKHFVGREYARRALEGFISRHGRGYFVVRGGPGQGKTALSCHLAKVYGCPHHFVSRVAGRTTARLALHSLLAQLGRPELSDPSLRQSDAELARAFVEHLAAEAARLGRVVILIDALDELEEEAGEQSRLLLTDALPEGVYVVATSRPSARLGALDEQLEATPYEVYDLGPLGLPEMREILRAHSPTMTEAEAERVAEASQGNPLYLRAAVEELGRDPDFDLRQLPQRIEGFFRRATKNVHTHGGDILQDVLGLLAVVRKPLTVGELGEVVGRKQRLVFEEGIRPVRQFLLEVDDTYCFYHAGFHDFVTRELLYEDELREYHQKVAEWLRRPSSRSHAYRWSSLAYHMFASGGHAELREVVDGPFLAEKVRRFGYAVLEDVELLARSMLDAGDPSLVERCVELVEGLREVVGGDIIEEAAHAVRPYRPGPPSFRTQLVAPPLPSVPGLDVYAGMLPKVDVAADFLEVVPLRQRLFVAVGDVPATGLRSAFIARFIGNLFRKLVSETSRPHLGRLLGELNSFLSAHEYFKWISMQCAAIDPEGGVVALASASHPYPVLYSARRGKCDRLPVRGDLLNSPLGEGAQQRYEQRHAEIAPGDILVMLTDGLTEGHLLAGDPYGYRFTRLVEQMAGQSAKSVGEAILDDWRAHLREGDYADDVTVVVIVVKDRKPDAP